MATSSFGAAVPFNTGSIPPFAASRIKARVADRSDHWLEASNVREWPIAVIGTRRGDQPALTALAIGVPKAPQFTEPPRSRVRFGGSSSASFLQDPPAVARAESI